MKTKTKKEHCRNCMDLCDAINKELYPLEMVLDSLELRMLEKGTDKFNPMSSQDLRNLSGTVWATKDNIRRVVNAAC